MINKMDIKKENIKMRVTPEQSKLVQEICFGLGIYWFSGRNYVQWVEERYVFLDTRGIRCTNLATEYTHDSGEEVSAEEFIRTKGFTENITQEIKQENTPKNNFKEFGFEADFEGEILKELYDHNNKKYYIGYSIDVRKGIKFPYPKTWTEDGKCWNDDDTNMEDFNLNIIKILKKQTLLIKEDEEHESGFKFKLVGNSGQSVYDSLNQGWKLASKDSVLSLLRGEEND